MFPGLPNFPLERRVTPHTDPLPRGVFKKFPILHQLSAQAIYVINICIG